MKRIERRAEFLDELERDADPANRVFDGRAAIIPRTKHRWSAERIAPGATERVPVDDGETEMFRHCLSFNNFARVIPAEGEGVFRLGAFVGDLADFGKGSGHCRF